MSLGPSARAMCSAILSRVLVGARHVCDPVTVDGRRECRRSGDMFSSVHVLYVLVFGGCEGVYVLSERCAYYPRRCAARIFIS